MSLAQAAANDPQPSAPRGAQDAAILDELAALDLAAARHVHARLMAAETPAEVSELARAYQRMARSVRQSLALKSKLTADAEQAARTEPPPAATGGLAIARRTAEVRDAVCRVIWDERERPKSREELAYRFSRLLHERRFKPDFIAETLDDQIARLCLELGLTAEAAGLWRTLPEAPLEFRARIMPLRAIPQNSS